MSDYIKREDAIKVNENYVPYQRLGEDRQSYMDRVLKELPSADVVEVRHATDKGYEDSYGWKDVCSLCGCEFRVSKSANYCPNCGARMDGESDE